MHYETDIAGEGRRPLYEVRRHPIFVLAGIATTIFLHAGIVAFFLLLGDAEEETEEPDKPDEHVEFEDVELLKMGEEKPEDQLPRISNPAPSTPEQETVTLDEQKPEESKEEPEKTQEKTESPPDPNARKDNARERKAKMNEAVENLTNPNRPTNEEMPEGSEQGVAEGTVTDRELANMMGTYQAKLLKAIGEFWEIPQTISEDRLEELFGKASVFVRLSESGHVVSYRFLNRTPNEQFNQSIERVMRQFQASGGGHTLPLPKDERVRKAVRNRGLRLEEWRFTQK